MGFREKGESLRKTHVDHDPSASGQQLRVGEVGEGDAGEDERGEGEEPERPSEIGGCRRRWMGAAVMRRRRRARGQRWHRQRLEMGCAMREGLGRQAMALILPADGRCPPVGTFFHVQLRVGGGTEILRPISFRRL
jgi:hypothetical protein